MAKEAVAAKTAKVEAKKTKAAPAAPVKEAAAAKPAKKEAPESKFGIADLAEELDRPQASVRASLRKAGIKKQDHGRYGWDTKAELKEVAGKLSKAA